MWCYLPLVVDFAAFLFGIVVFFALCSSGWWGSQLFSLSGIAQQNGFLRLVVLSVLAH